jgi:hypothetical protein
MSLDDDVIFKCLCCDGKFVRKGHRCPIIPSCEEIGHHVDICRTCRRLVLANFESQVQITKQGE